MNFISGSAVADLSFGQRRKKTKMSAGTSSSFCLIFCFLVCSSGAQTNIRAELGQEVVLPCKVPNNININNIRAIEWSRPGHDPEYVLFYRDGHFDPYNQHPSYQNRVDLQDEEMKDGDVSLVLKVVKMEDTGKYECHVFHRETNRRKRSSSDSINIINLEVLPPGKLDEISGDGGDKTGIIVGSVVGVILLLLLAVFASVGFLTLRNHRRQNPNIPVSADEAAV